MANVIVLGAKGRVGRAAARAFAEAGWSVTRAGRGIDGPGSVQVDATDRAAVTRACAGADVIVNAVNPPYHHWVQTVPKVTEAVIAAARAHGATVMIPGNIYNYGHSLPPVLREDTPWVANTRKGGIRIRMERAYRDSGVRTIVLRSGDYFEAAQTGDWFGSYITAKLGQGKVTYPGPRDQVHAWAYLPDVGRAMAALADLRSTFDTFEEFNFDGYALTGDDLIALIEQAVGRPLRVTPFPWFAVRMMGLWSPLMREVLEMRYLWQRPHAVDGTKLNGVLPAFRSTPVDRAIAASVRDKTEAYVTDAARA
ncbi:NAD-dependent epimerase/dehydratase family protein [uncultured Tateyamaria sp.]|uniref:NAD-dependent epimerase/dehydratase family protein n=1 Tax=uncultured Tateyamaria sp. TaxID=455651 RepID=UPI0026222853|nr:NAD-dependent epimerase/dehydratase family protein [uncultured Tateyamaria sp.]